MFPVVIRYWAGAAAAAGVESETIEAGTVAEALASAAAGRGPALERVIGISSILVDGLRSTDQDRDENLAGAVQVEVLPPFAGG